MRPRSVHRATPFLYSVQLRSLHWILLSYYYSILYVVLIASQTADMPRAGCRRISPRDLTKGPLPSERFLFSHPNSYSPVICDPLSPGPSLDVSDARSKLTIVLEMLNFRTRRGFFSLHSVAESPSVEVLLDKSDRDRFRRSLAPL